MRRAEVQRPDTIGGIKLGGEKQGGWQGRGLVVGRAGEEAWQGRGLVVGMESAGGWQGRDLWLEEECEGPAEALQSMVSFRSHRFQDWVLL